MDTNEHDEIIERLKGQAAGAADGRVVVHESANLTSELREQFWRHVVEFETADTTNLVKELKAAGLDPLDPDGLNDEALHSALWTTIEALGRMRVYLNQTDHLSDRELYTLLWRDLLPEEMPALDVDASSEWHIDIFGAWSEVDTAVYLKYYADTTAREQWRLDSPDHDLPDHEDPPYDRDRHLPPYEEKPTS